MPTYRVVVERIYRDATVHEIDAQCAFEADEKARIESVDVPPEHFSEAVSVAVIEMDQLTEN